MRIRNFDCNIEPQVGRYRCTQDFDDFDYIRLSSGEMETFRININAVAEGIYRLRVAAQYSIGGQTKEIEHDHGLVEIGIFDPVLHKPEHLDKRKTI
jgi:hypothetical protein